MRRPQSLVPTPTAAVPYLAISLGPRTCIDSTHLVRGGALQSPREGISDIRAAAEPSCVPPRPPFATLNKPVWPNGGAQGGARSGRGLSVGLVDAFGLQPAVEIRNAD